MTPLPIDAALPEIVAAVRASRSLVLVAPPGAGKTTRVPPALLRAGLLSADHPNLVILQPRRVAARASAERIADENGWTLGREVGYHVRFDRQIGPDTRLRVLTEGILTRQLLDDPFLEGTGAVLLDEFHERNLHTDLCVALLKEIRQTVRDDLILVVMSATLEADPVSRYLGNCPIVRTEGRTFPVEIRHAVWSQDTLPERAATAVLNALSHSALPSPPSDSARFDEAHRRLSTRSSALNPDPGDILVFLPGVEEIRRTMNRLETAAAQNDLLVLPLHGSLPPEDQRRALRPARQRKVICATNIAETSLTIDGVRTVIDTGYARIAGYDAERGLDRLELRRISKASAAQRAGRAGRTAPGQCVRLWSASEERAMPDFTPPEIERVDLAGTVLLLHAWGKPDPRAFGWYEPPPEGAIAAAERLLTLLGALTAETAGQITPLGRRIMALPVHPRLARLLVAAAEQGLVDDGATIAALLSEKDIVWEDRQSPPWARETKTVGASDLLIRLDLLREAERSRFAANLRDRGINPEAARQVAKVRDDLLRIAGRLERRGPRQNQNQSLPADEDALLKLALLAYPDRVCRRRASDPAAAAMVGGGGVRLAAESVVRQGELFLALDARQDPRSPTREATVRVASRVDAGWLEALFPQSLRRERTVEFDPQRQRVVGTVRTYYLDLLLREDAHTAVDPAAAGAALAAALRPRAGEWFAADEAAANFLARVALLRRHLPEHPWPALDESELGDVLAEACAGKRTVEDARRVPLVPLLMSRLPYPLDRLLEQHAPDKITVPTGNAIRLDYTAGAVPVLAVRLQEVFGWLDTPRVAAGRVPVLLHLLGPNYRPVQITDDLRSFWTNTYFQVRKDLRVRYPKHSWPDDPLTAAPVAKGRPRK